MTKPRSRRPKEEQAAIEVAKETLRSTATADWFAERKFMLESRGTELTISQVHEKMGTVTARAFNTAVQVLLDNTLHAPTVAEKRKNAEILVKLHLAEVELKLKYLSAYTGLDAHGEYSPPSAADDKPVVLQQLPELPPMTEEQMTELIQARRAQRAG